MFRFRFVVHIFIRTQYLHFPASCSSKKTKARKNKGEINAELKQTGFCFCFFQHTGRLCDEANQERNTADRRLDFISKCTSTSTDAFIPICFFCQWELNYGGVSKCFVIAIWDKYIYIYIHIYTCFHPPRTYLFISFATGLYLYTHFDGQLKSQLSSHQPVVWQPCPSLQWACIIRHIFFRNNLWMCYRIGHHSFYLLLLLLHLHIWKMHKCILSSDDQNHGLGTTMLAELLNC